MAKKENVVLPNVVVEGMSSEGKGVSKVDGKVVFTAFAVPGDVADVEVRKNKKNLSEAVIRELKTPSPSRVDPPCRHFTICGGCKWQHIDYAEQLRYKKQIVADAFQRIAKL